ncbi:hypothetical protein KC347_g99 [Hortaea werneckii]|nr:hypothetical protein KC347_g99 [Hortaea werneckii]
MAQYWIGIPPLPAQTVRDTPESILAKSQNRGINEVPNHWQSLHVWRNASAVIMIPFVAVGWDIFASLMGPPPKPTPQNSVTQLAHITEVTISNHRPQAESVYLLPAPPPAAFFSSATGTFCLASMMAATFSFSR